MQTHYIIFDRNIEHPHSELIEKTVNALSELEDFEVTSPNKIDTILGKPETASLINPYGKNFPFVHWNSFLTFLENGGNWMNIGGKPLRMPLSTHSLDINERNSYHRELGIYHYPLIKASRFESYKANPRFPDLDKVSKNLPFADIHEIYYTLVNETDRTKLDVFTNPTGETDYLIMAHGEGNRPLAAAAFLWDHLWGRFNGSRWILINWNMNAELWASKNFIMLLQALAKKLRQGAGIVKIRPVFASYYPHERPTLKIYARNAGGTEKGKIRVTGKIERDKNIVKRFSRNLAYNQAEEKYIAIDAIYFSSAWL